MLKSKYSIKTQIKRCQQYFDKDVPSSLKLFSENGELVTFKLWIRPRVYKVLNPFWIALLSSANFNLCHISPPTGPLLGSCSSANSFIWINHAKISFVQYPFCISGSELYSLLTYFRVFGIGGGMGLPQSTAGILANL